MRFSQLFNDRAKEGSSALGVASAADLQAKATQKHYDELSANGMAEAVGVIATNTTGNHPRSEAQKKKERDEKFNELRQRVLDGIKELERWERLMLEKARELEVGIERKQKFIENTTHEMMENSDFIGFIKKSQDDFKNGKPVDFDAVKTRLRERGVKVSENMSVKEMLYVVGDKESRKANEKNKNGDNLIHKAENEIEQDRLNSQKLRNEAKELNDELYDINNRGFSTEEKDLLIQQAMSKHGETANRILIKEDVAKTELINIHNQEISMKISEQKSNLDDLLGGTTTQTAIATSVPKPH